jgi:uncharacterized protein
MLLHDLVKRNLIHPPRWLPNQTIYLTVMGSHAYGVSGNTSDQDIYSVCIPPKELVFPHLAGEIPGFGRQIQRFELWSQHHIRHPDKKVEYDFSVFGIVKFFQLCMDNNPNVLDSLFAPRTAIIHSTPVAEMFGENRKLFLHKGAWHRFKGYAYSQASKIRNKVNSSNPQRAADIEKHGYSTKFAYHCVRLMNEVEQILVEGDLDLQRNREQLKSIRRGEWTFEQFEAYFQNKEHALETAYANSLLPHAPDEARLKNLLLQCLEQHYGDLSSAIKVQVPVEMFVNELETLILKYKGKLL